MSLNVKGQLARTQGADVILQAAGSSDIMVFTETWLGEGWSAPAIEGFMVFNLARPQRFQAGSAARRGGIACYVRDNLGTFVTLVESDCTNSYAVLRVNKAAGFQKDLYLIVTYIAPSSSTISSAIRNIWVEIEECVKRVSEIGFVLVVGDQNARTGSRPDFPESDLLGAGDGLIPVPTCSVRRNADREVNAHGLKMLALCKNTGLRIANGRTDGDREGAFTFVSTSGGASSVDNILACPSALPLITRLHVVPAAFTDHYAIKILLSTEGSRVSSARSVPIARAPRMAGAANIKRWAECVLPEFAVELESIKSSAPAAAAISTSELHALCDRFDRVLKNSFEQVQSQVTPRSQVAGHSYRKQPLWFDQELAILRRTAHAAMRRSPRSAIALRMQREYQTILRKKQRARKQAQVTLLASQARSNPKAFWSKYKTHKPLTSRISKDQWEAHFSSLLGESPVTNGNLATSSSMPSVGVPQRFTDGSELNTPFTALDVEHAIQCLNVKSSTLGFLSVHALKVAAPLLAPCVAALFNSFALVGSLPPSWAVSAITPIFKSGDIDVPGNYRGIAVGTVLSKLFAKLINSRLTHWAESNGVRAAGQAGFREDYRCSDHLLILRTLIEQQRERKLPLYTCFVDFRKAYDSVPRDLLWRKLAGRGVQGWFLDSIKALYGSVPMAVKTNEGLSSSFECVMGVKQGCPLSPTLFGMYLDDLERVFMVHHETLDLPEISVQRVPVLLYADDLALVATSARGLQSQLDLLHAYADTWGLTVNIDKTKAVIFRQSPSNQVYPTPMYDGASIEIVNTFKYLGIMLHCTKPFASAAVPRSEAGERSQLAMFSRCSELGIKDPALRMQLWDSLVQPCILYGVEFWGAPDICKGVLAGDGLHRDFLRRLLGVHSGTPNMAVLAEVGRYPLVVKAAKLLCNFWNRLVEMDDGRLVKQAFLHSAALGPLTRSNSNHKSWAGQVGKFLSAIGMPCDLSSPQTVSVSAVVEKLQSSYLASVNACSGVKMQQYLSLISNVDTASYSPAAHLRAVVKWEQRKHLCATLNKIALAGSGNGSLWGGKGGERAKAVSALRRQLS